MGHLINSLPSPGASRLAISDSAFRRRQNTRSRPRCSSSACQGYRGGPAHVTFMPPSFKHFRRKHRHEGMSWHRGSVNGGECLGGWQKTHQRPDTFNVSHGVHLILRYTSSPCCEPSSSLPLRLWRPLDQPAVPPVPNATATRRALLCEPVDEWHLC